MASAEIRQNAERLYENGHEQYRQGRYEQALAELELAEEAFRKLDTPGHPFTDALPNGVSGLANVLALSGHCHQQLGAYDNAITCYETSLVNAKFEHTKPFKLFFQKLREDMLTCYGKKVEHVDAKALEAVLERDDLIDTSYIFPFSLREDWIPVARLYELAPERYGHFKTFYEQVQQKDKLLRRIGKQSDEIALSRMSVYTWGILTLIWLIYGFVVIRALFNR